MAPEHCGRSRPTAVAVLMSAAALSLSVSAAPPYLDTRHVMAHMERLSEAALKSLYLRCADESSRRVLSLHEAIECSIAADVLKERGFGGDFDAMLAWWRRHRDGS